MCLRCRVSEGHLASCKGEKRETTSEPASQHLASDRKEWETEGDKRETSPQPASQHLACDRRDWETQGDKRRHERTQGDKREMGDTGRQAGDTTPEPVTASQRLRDNRETSRKHERLGDRKTSGKQDLGTGVTLSHSLYLKLEPQCFAVWGITKIEWLGKEPSK